MINKLFQNLFRICPKTGGIVGLKIRQHWAVLFFPVIGLAALIWYLVRVIPKPSRAAYPCQRVAAPLAMGFVASVLGWVGASAAFRNAKKQLMEHRYRLAAACAILGLVLASVGTLSLSSGYAVASGIDNGKNTGTFTPSDAPNQPIGTGKGINPGRVVWAHNADATSWNGSSNYWYSDAYNNQTVINDMLRQAVLSQAGQTDLRTAWNEIFRYNNQQRGRGSVGYTVGEKIAIKVNVNSGGGGSNRLDESPHLVYAMLDELVNVVGVRQADIVIYDAMRSNMSAIYDHNHGAFPNVLYNNYGSRVDNAMTYSYHITDYNARQLPSAVVNATYLINMAALKRHLTPSTSYSEGQGQTAVTLTAKNHCGSIFNCSALHDDFRDWNEPMGNYNPLVDFMANANVGRKTVLYVIDGLYSTNIHNGTPQRWPMAPFNNDWPSSVFISQDPVAIDSVGVDFLRSRWTLAANADNFLHEAAQIGNPPSGVNYLGKALGSMGVHEHWNNATDRQYSRNLGTGQGIELVYIEGSGPIITPTPSNTPTITPTQPPGSNTYQAEAASYGGGVTIDSNNAGFLGTGYANFPLSGGFVQFNSVDGGTGGNATLRIRFALGATTARTGLLIVNGASRSITFNPTGAWTTWTTQDVTVPLNSGTTNILRFESNGQDLANLDQIQVIPSGGPTNTPTATATKTSTPTATRTPTITPTQPPGSNVYQAEAASFGGGVTIDSNNAGFLGTGYANFPLSGGYVQFNNADGGTGGSATLRIRYALGATTARTGLLIVNGASQNITFNPTGAWTTWMTQDVTVPLNGGTTNTLRFESNGQDLANLDQVEVILGNAITSTPTTTATLGPTNTPTPTWTVTLTAPPNTNLALNRPASSSSNESSSFTPNLAVDGNATTRWASVDPATTAQWIYVDLGSTYNVNRVKLTWEAAYAASYQVQVSNDASTWTTIYSTTTGNGGSDDLTGLSGSGRYVRIYCTVRGTAFGYSLWEFEVYGN